MNSPKKTVTLEDLLRVKRAERPPAEFWTDFDRELRAKQLAAIIEPRPWWAPLIRIGARMSHYQLPAGAAAILAISFLTLSHQQNGDPRLAPVAEIPRPALQVLPEAVADYTPSSPQLAAPTPSPAQLARTEVPADPVPEAVVATGRTAHAVLLLGESPVEPEPSPSARAIAANLAAAQATDPHILTELFGAVPTEMTVRDRPRDPLAQISSPSESRRSRLLGTALPVPAGYSDVEVGSSDRVVRRLTEDRLYDSISRIGVRGDRVAIKF